MCQGKKRIFVRCIVSYHISQIACVFCCGDAACRNTCHIGILAAMGMALSGNA